MINKYLFYSLGHEADIDHIINTSEQYSINTSEQYSGNYNCG